jgi:hypothetical protein
MLKISRRKEKGTDVKTSKSDSPEGDPWSDEAAQEPEAAKPSCTPASVRMLLRQIGPRDYPRVGRHYELLNGRAVSSDIIWRD